MPTQLEYHQQLIKCLGTGTFDNSICKLGPLLFIGPINILIFQRKYGFLNSLAIKFACSHTNAGNVLLAFIWLSLMAHVVKKPTGASGLVLLLNTGWSDILATILSSDQQETLYFVLNLRSMMKYDKVGFRSSGNVLISDVA